MGEDKAHRPYEFGVKVSVATPIARARGGQFALHAKAMPGNPYDGHTLATVIPKIEALVGNTIERVLADAGYRGHNVPPKYKFRVYTAGQKRRMTPQIKRQMRRRSAVEPVLPNFERKPRRHLRTRKGPTTVSEAVRVGSRTGRNCAAPGQPMCPNGSGAGVGGFFGQGPGLQNDNERLEKLGPQNNKGKQDGCWSSPATHRDRRKASS